MAKTLEEQIAARDREEAERRDRLRGPSEAYVAALEQLLEAARPIAVDPLAGSVDLAEARWEEAKAAHRDLAAARTKASRG